jgi:epoxyqueuosine reductase
MTTTVEPRIRCIPATTNKTLLKIFGTLMPSLLLLKQAPGQFWALQRAMGQTPEGDIAEFVQTHTDDVGQVGNTLVFVHRWQSTDFDPVVFARAKVFLAQMTRMVQQAGYSATPFDPLSPGVNLPQLAVDAGLGDFSPYGLLVHPKFGPRVILTALTTDYPLMAQSQWPAQPGCTDCMVCVRRCPQAPLQTGFVKMSECKSCTRCLSVCPVGLKDLP